MLFVFLFYFFCLVCKWFTGLREGGWAREARLDTQKTRLSLLISLEIIVLLVGRFGRRTLKISFWRDVK